MDENEDIDNVEDPDANALLKALGIGLLDAAQRDIELGTEPDRDDEEPQTPDRAAARTSLIIERINDVIKAEAQIAVLENHAGSIPNYVGTVLGAKVPGKIADALQDFRAEPRPDDNQWRLYVPGGIDGIDTIFLFSYGCPVKTKRRGGVRVNQHGACTRELFKKNKQVYHPQFSIDFGEDSESVEAEEPLPPRTILINYFIEGYYLRVHLTVGFDLSKSGTLIPEHTSTLICEHTLSKHVPDVTPRSESQPSVKATPSISER